MPVDADDGPIGAVEQVHHDRARASPEMNFLNSQRSQTIGLADPSGTVGSAEGGARTGRPTEALASPGHRRRIQRLQKYRVDTKAQPTASLALAPVRAALLSSIGDGMQWEVYDDAPETQIPLPQLPKKGAGKGGGRNWNDKRKKDGGTGGGGTGGGGNVVVGVG